MKQIQLEEIKQLSFWEVIIPFSGQLGIGGDLPDYFEQGNCNILPNKTGVLIQKDVFLYLIDQTKIIEDFSIFYFFKNVPAFKNQERYQQNYLDKETIQADYILPNLNLKEKSNT